MIFTLTNSTFAQFGIALRGDYGLSPKHLPTRDFRRKAAQQGVQVRGVFTPDVTTGWALAVKYKSNTFLLTNRFYSVGNGICEATNEEGDVTNYAEIGCRDKAIFYKSYGLAFERHSTKMKLDYQIGLNYVRNVTAPGYLSAGSGIGVKELFWYQRLPSVSFGLARPLYSGKYSIFRVGLYYQTPLIVNRIYELSYVNAAKGIDIKSTVQERSSSLSLTLIYELGYERGRQRKRRE